MSHFRKYNINENYFDTWSSNMAYILGFITADGYNDNRSIIFGLNPKDIEVLKFIRCEIGDNQIIKITKKFDKRYNKYYDNAYLALNSVVLCRKLKDKFGIIKNKTGYENICFDIPLEFKYDYIRGLFDGDGNVNYDGSIDSNICSASIVFLGQIKSLCDNLGCIRRNNTIYKLFFNKNDSLKLRDRMYKNNTLFKLQRKYDIFYSYIDKSDHYTITEIELMKKYNGNMQLISDLTGRSYDSLHKKYKKLGIKRITNRFTDEQILFIKNNMNNLTITAIANSLGKERHSISKKIKELSSMV